MRNAIALRNKLGAKGVEILLKSMETDSELMGPRLHDQSNHSPQVFQELPCPAPSSPTEPWRFTGTISSGEGYAETYPNPSRIVPQTPGHTEWPFFSFNQASCDNMEYLSSLPHSTDASPSLSSGQSSLMSMPELDLNTFPIPCDNPLEAPLYQYLSHPHSPAEALAPGQTTQYSTAPSHQVTPPSSSPKPAASPRTATALECSESPLARPPVGPERNLRSATHKRSTSKIPHHMVERRYRNNINDKITLLRTMIPRSPIRKTVDNKNTFLSEKETFFSEDEERMNKGTVLRKTIEYIHQLEQERTEALDDAERIKVQLRLLERSVMSGEAKKCLSQANRDFYSLEGY